MKASIALLGAAAALHNARAFAAPGDWGSTTIYSTLYETMWYPTTVYQTVPTTLTLYVTETEDFYYTYNFTSTTTTTTTTSTSTTTTTPTTTTTTTPTTEWIYITNNFTTTTTTTTPTTTTTTTPTTTTTTTSTTTTTPTTTTTSTTGTVTATEIISEYIISYTEQITITLCTSRVANPTYTAAIAPLPSDYTWGCPPGYVCKPAQIGCNFEVGLPDPNYYCSPDECIAAAPPGVLPEWNADVYGNNSPAIDPSLKYPVVDSYFDMNPTDYGLTYDIFVENEVLFQTLTTTIIEQPTGVVRARQAETSIPGACYPWCNNCLIEAQSVGKTPALCAAGSAFEIDMSDCEQCIAYHKSDSTADFVKIAPQFQQFINYCNPVTTTVIVSPTTATQVSTPVPVVATNPTETSTFYPAPTTSTATYLTSSTVVSESGSSYIVPGPSSPPASSPPTTTETLPTSTPSKSTITQTETFGPPTTVTYGAESTPSTPATSYPANSTTWTTTLVLTLTGPTTISIGPSSVEATATTAPTTTWTGSSSTITTTMTLEGPSTVTYGAGGSFSGESTSFEASSSPPPSSSAAPQSSSSTTAAASSTFTGAAVPVKSGGTSALSVLLSVLLGIFAM